MVGGGEHSFLSLLANLRDSWHPLAVVPSPGDLSVALETAAVPIDCIPLPRIHPLNLSKMLKTLKALAELCKRYKPALIYANGSRAAFYSGLLKLTYKVPVIWHCRVAQKDPLLDALLQFFSDRIIANSQATAARFRAKRQGKIRVIYNGLDIAHLRDHTVCRPHGLEDEWEIILVIARVSKWKRHDLILYAFETIADQIPNAHLVCVGARDPFESSWWDHLQLTTTKSRYSDRIHWIGQVDDVRPWYRAADVMVLASDNEPFGRVIVEAMACNVPVIATRTGGVPEIIRHGRDGLLVSPENDRELAGAIAKVLNEADLRNRLVRHGRQRAEMFDLGSHLEKMNAVFEEAA
jgi:glycosyltransferase involved in cell wall biosynthesis